MFYYIYFLSLFSLIFFYFYLFPGILEFWCLATVTFKFTLLKNNIYRKKTNTFQKIFDECGRKPSKICVDKGSEFYNRLMKSRLRDNDIEMYSASNEGKSLLLKDY